MKKSIITICCLFLAVSLFVNCSPKKKDLDGLIKEMVVEEGRGCPKAVGVDIRLDSVNSPENGVLAYYYSLLNVGQGEMIGMDFNQLEKVLINTIKATAGLDLFRELNGTFRYAYYDKTGKLLHTFNITSDKYNN